MSWWIEWKHNDSKYSFCEDGFSSFEEAKEKARIKCKTEKCTVRVSGKFSNYGKFIYIEKRKCTRWYPVKNSYLDEVFLCLCSGDEDFFRKEREEFERNS